jgi:hypothetical protein
MTPGASTPGKEAATAPAIGLSVSAFAPTTAIDPASMRTLRDNIRCL